MFDFFAALFGSLYYGDKYIREKNAGEKAKLEAKQRESKYSLYRTKYHIRSAEEKYRLTNFVMSGEHYDEICEMFEEYFAEVLGENWKNELQLPKPNMSSQDIKFWNKYKDHPHGCWHTGWVYDLLLARNKRIDNVYSIATLVSDYEWRRFQIKSLKTVEDELHKQGETSIRFVMVCDYTPGAGYRTPSAQVGAGMTIEGLSVYPTCRLW